MVWSFLNTIGIKRHMLLNAPKARALLFVKPGLNAVVSNLDVLGLILNKACITCISDS